MAIHNFYQEKPRRRVCFHFALGFCIPRRFSHTHARSLTHSLTVDNRTKSGRICSLFVILLWHFMHLYVQTVRLFVCTECLYTLDTLTLNTYIVSLFWPYSLCAAHKFAFFQSIWLSHQIKNYIKTQKLNHTLFGLLLFLHLAT